MGRPLSFDPEMALVQALYLFWQHGYDGVSITDLTEGLGIARPSLYAMFGNKEKLFERVIEKYYAEHMQFSQEALQRSKATDVAHGILHGFVDVTTGPQTPLGCLVVNAAMASTDDNARIQHKLAVCRARTEHKLRHRFKRALDEGDLPPSADPARIAKFLLIIARGIAVQARVGVSREELHAIVDTALGAGLPST